jgi:hypothetical protein
VSHDFTFRGTSRCGDPSPERPDRGARKVDHRRKLAKLVWEAWAKHKMSIAEIAQRYHITTAEAGRLLFEVDEDD